MKTGGLHYLLAAFLLALIAGCAKQETKTDPAAATDSCCGMASPSPADPSITSGANTLRSNRYKELTV